MPLFADGTEIIHIKGSDTMIVVAQAWSEAYERVNSKVTVSVGGGGSGTGLDALLQGTVEVANVSRRMDTHELKRAKRLGMRPVQHIVGYDALAVFVNRNNPIESLSLSQLEQIYGEGGAIRKWTDLNVNVAKCSEQEVVRAGRQNNSGTYVYFRNVVLGRGKDYDFGIMDMLSSKDVVHLVEKTPCAIGYSGLAYATPKVKMICLEKTKGQPCIKPGVTSAVDGSYPIARPLFMYTREEPKGAIKEYIDWILSDQGQCIIAKKGYAPVRNVKCN
jgi:phosphate transport system substrate-binding protein